MGEEFHLQALTRDKQEKTKALRREEYIPAVLYGPGADNKSLKVKKGEFEKVYNRAGESSLVNLKIDDQQEVKVLVKDIQRDPIKEEVVHIDFYQVKMDEKIYTEVPLEFVGESRAVKEQGGYLEKSLDTVEIECLPGNLVHEITVDVSGLETFEDYIKVKDLPDYEGVTIETDPEEIVASVTPPKTEEETEEEEGESEAGASEAASESSEE